MNIKKLQGKNTGLLQMCFHYVFYYLVPFCEFSKVVFEAFPNFLITNELLTKPFAY